MNFYTLSESWECLFSLLEAASPGALQVCSLEPTYMFSGCVEFRMGGYWRQKKKMINSTPVQQYSKFWSSSPNYLLLFMFQSLHPLCLVLYSCSQSVQPGGVCFFCMMQNWKISSTFFEPGQKRTGDLIHRATLLSSITTTAPLPWVSLPQLMLLPSTHLQEFHRDRLQLELRQLWCLAHGGLQRVQTTKKHFFLQKSIPII